MSEYTLSNGKISALISSLGAELRSIKDEKDREVFEASYSITVTPT